MRAIGLLILRVIIGGLMAGHGAQKLFGWFGGGGIEGTANWMESIGLRPGVPWAIMAGLSEFGGGVLTALGLLNPLGAIGIISSMIMASAKAHSGNPIWVTEGGPELPVINMAAATALGMGGPGRFSLDRILGIKTPFTWIGLAVATAAAALTIGLKQEEEVEEISI